MSVPNDPDGVFFTPTRNVIARLAMKTAASAFGVPVERLASQHRCGAQVALARQTAMYLSHVVGQLSLSDISTEFGRDRTTASHACHLIEDRRDSPMFDLQMDILETHLRERIKAVLPNSNPGLSRRTRLRHAARALG